MRIDTIIRNARVWTGDPARPTAHSIGVLHGRIIGLDDDLEELRADHEIDAGGGYIAPGFNDAHFHFSGLGLEMEQLDLSAAAASTLDALYERVERHAATLPADAWVLGHGYDQNKIGEHPSRAVLDRIAGGRPVHLLHNSGHMSVVNSEALRRAGHDVRSMPADPVGGHIDRDERGEVTGLLQEQAMGLVDHVLRPVGQEALATAIAAASRWCLRNGLTSVTEPGVAGITMGNSPADVRAFQVARERGLLHTRMTLMPYIDVLHGIGDIGDIGEAGGAAGGGVDGWGIDLGIRSGFGDDWVRLGAVKVMSDGSLIGRTAAMHRDYRDTPCNSGFMQWDEDELHGLLVTAHRNGWQVAAHAIGDRALDIVLDAFDEGQTRFPRKDARHRIEHAAVVSERQLGRIVAGGYVPVPQGRFISELGDGFRDALGEEGTETAYRMRSFIDAGVELPGSTDAPVVPGEPLLSIHDMVNRRSASDAPIGLGEAVTPAQALRAYTHGSAYASHDERRKGRLARGMCADLVVLSDDPERVPPESIREIQVRATMVDGVFRHDAAAEWAERAE